MIVDLRSLQEVDYVPLGSTDLDASAFAGEIGRDDG